METVANAFLEPRRELPTGVVTFLFTDIEGSTVRWERDPVAMQRALREHDEIMRDAIASTGGVVFKTVGDAFYAVFQTADAAVESAIASQRRLAETDFEHVDGLRVRMALHTGTADERDGDYFGQALNRVARLLSTGHGGQILLSHASAQLARERLPGDVSLADLGEHRLKDLTAPEHVFGLVAPGLESEFPKLKSLSILDNNLPQQLTSLIGRDCDVRAVKDLTKAWSLVTVIGAGGLGKTRVALQAGAEMLDAYPDGVWFVDLAPMKDPALLANTIGAVFELQESGSRPMLESLVAFLKPKKMLLILDNCEHVIGEASTVAAGILRACDGVKMIATSREHLNVAGEATFRLPSLSMPSAEAAVALGVDAALEYGAVDLFVTRARAANARFAFTADIVAVVAEIVRRLDGIPLAIELAAARVRVLAPKQLAEKLNERFRVLTGGDRTALPRQQTMRAAIDWSYDLLTPDEQRVFRMLSVFAGSFAIDTPAAVGADETLDELDIFAIVASLADKSLVNAEHGDEDIRYRLLESTRQYGAEKLVEAGEGEAVAARYAEAYAAIAESIVDDYDTAVHRTWFARVEAEIENVRAAVTWAFSSDGDPALSLRLAATLHRTMVFNVREAQRWVASAHERRDDGVESSLAGRLELAQAFLNNASNQFVAVHKHASRAIPHFDESGHTRAKADAQRLAGRALVYLGRVEEGESLLETALAAHRKLGSRGTGAALRDLALARAAAGDLERARSLLSESLRDFEHREDLANVAQTVGTLAGIEFQAGNTAAALRSAEQALDVLRKLKRRLSIAWILHEMATFSIASGAFDDANARARESLAMARELPSPVFVAHALRQLATIAAMRPAGDDAARADDLARSAHVFGFVDMRLVELETTLEPVEQNQMDAARTRLTGALGDALLRQYESEGSHFTEERAIATALALRP
ncbi:MAG: hypothetical protein IAI48_05605 [Candidatus Eremiobacteraeota bacterium]|nr:hypothetical protein [Candidatus Eremiobacteraeota bacterium]